jgi:hypothetical protein
VKSALSLTVIASLVGSALPVAARDRLESTAGPIARAVTREAVRLATEPAWSGIQQASGTAESDWSRVRKLVAATEVVVTVQGAQPGKRYFVRADESDLTVLNPTDPTLPRTAMRGLMDMASNQPEYFTARKGTLVNKELRVGPDGVFVADRKVADLGQIVERIARTDVVTVRTKIRSGHQALGGALGTVGGFFAGSLVGAAIEGPCACDMPGFKGQLVGAPLGAIAGGIFGYLAFSNKTEDVIYRAP